jgi:hypothetical protein
LKTNRRSVLFLLAILYFISALGSGLAWDWYTFAFYAVCMVGQLIWVLLLMRETKGISLEVIQKQMVIE